MEGQYRGVLAVNFQSYQSFQFLQVTAQGPWAVTFEDPRTAQLASTDSGAVFTGSGDDVFLFQASGPTLVQIQCDTCESNFQVTGRGRTNHGLVNEVGAYGGQVIVPADTVLVEVRSSGYNGQAPTWTFTPD